MIPELLAIRFGTGLSPTIAAPSDVDEALARLSGPDEAAEAVRQPGWDAKVAIALDWSRLRRLSRREGGEAFKEDLRARNRELTAGYHQDLARALTRAAATRDGLRERLAWFWADHFAVVDEAGFLRRTTAGYHEDAIRPHVAGRFGDLLVSAVTHPAMVSFLDQQRSIGPNSPAGAKGAGLNENLAREVLELHTLGVGAGYDQADVRQLAELFTGLAVDKEGGPEFRRRMAEPGTEEVLGHVYGGDPARMAHVEAVLRDLAVHPDTARHLSGKLARHFVSDEPPGDMVAAMAAEWTRTGGELIAVYRAMMTHPAAADPALHKARRPLDLVAAGLRALGQTGNLAGRGTRIIRMGATTPLLRMGQSWQRPPGPQGWPEEAEAWITPQGLAARIEWAMTVAHALREPPDPRVFVETALGPLAGARVRFAAGAAETRGDGVALVLASPEFQRR